LQNFTLTNFSGFIDMLRLAANEGDRSRPNACAWTELGLDRRLIRFAHEGSMRPDTG